MVNTSMGCQNLVKPIGHEMMTNALADLGGAPDQFFSSHAVIWQIW